MKKYLNAILDYNVKKKKLLTDKDQLILLFRLNILLNHGFTLLEAFSFLNMHIKYKQKNTSETILNLLKNGENCHHILSFLNYPQTIVTQIYFAERFGRLSENLTESHAFLKRKAEAKQRFIKTIQYPLILIGIFMCMLFGINYFILPEFQQIYTTMDIQLSPLLKTLNFIIQHFPHIFLIFSGLVCCVALIIHLYIKKLNTPQKIKFISKLPLIKTYYKLFKTYQIANELALFYRNGIVLRQISLIYTEQNIDLFLKYLGEMMIKKIEEGMKLPEILSSIGCFQAELIQFIEQGEKSGKTDIELSIYTEILLSQIENQMNKQIKIIQPVIFLLLGFLIISLYLVIMLPMFDMLQSIK
ncbi:type II secretion system F family protein [Staphylococcus simulans]|uniref:competence type IV pilus assembly protein ComGB n=1 Tax=Staphylococcus simulans TaxID=1286 RepID=UPI000D03DDEC|nr:competence type IV pilus assembly protein ComGB [Staphylococcus simulans]MCD8915033.1 type II secretion system F family protein [Staphylococcus simulans]